ncbi:hypothetical protein BHE74_00015198, partial [Ensete ventricosum]
VGLQPEDGNLESPKAIPDVGKIILEDNPSGELGTENNLVSDDKSQGTASLKGQSDVSTSNISSEMVPTNDDDSTKKTQKPHGEADGLAQEQKAKVKKPIVRAKVPFEKGYSQMDWLKLTRTHPDLAGEDMLMKAAGRDSTSLFIIFNFLLDKYHAWVNAEALLERCRVGILEYN